MTRTAKLYVVLVLCVHMGRTTIEVDEAIRDELRRYKAQDGDTYDEAISKLLTQASGWDPDVTIQNHN